MPSLTNATNARIDRLANGRVGRTFFSLSAPAVIGMMTIALYNVVDTFFVGLLRDTASIAATGIVFPIFQLIGAVGLTFGIGAASVVSRRLGEGNHRAAERAAATALYTVIIIGVSASVVGGFFAPRILAFFGATPSILVEATAYGRVIIAGSVFQMMNMCLNNLLRSEGAALYSSIAQISGAILNIILDPIFIFLLEMGVTGAAVATVIAHGAAMIFLLAFYVQKRGTIAALRPSSFSPTLRMYREIMHLGLPTLVRQVLGSASFAILNNAAASHGDSAIAAIGISMRLLMFMAMALMGMGQGLQPLAGYNFGAGRLDRVRRSFRVAAITAVATATAAAVPGFLLAPTILRLFAPQDAEVVRLGALTVRMMAVAVVPAALAIIFGSFFQALGKGQAALTLALGQQGLFLIPLVLVLPRVLGVNGVLSAQPISFVMAFLIGLALMVRVWSSIDDQIS